MERHTVSVIDSGATHGGIDHFLPASLTFFPSDEIDSTTTGDKVDLIWGWSYTTQGLFSEPRRLNPNVIDGYIYHLVSQILY